MTTREKIEQESEAHLRSIAERICAAIDRTTKITGKSASVQIMEMTGISNLKQKLRAKHVSGRKVIMILVALQAILKKEKAVAKEVGRIISDLF